MTQRPCPPAYGRPYPPAAPQQARRWPWIVGGMTLLLLIGLAITAREWQLIAKDPGAHRGESVVVHEPAYGFADYDTNTVLAGTPSQLADVVQGDLFTAEVVVGSR
jgi:hypothetical protein